MSAAAAGVLLAAGSSQPLGQPVQLVDVAGRPLLEVLVESMRDWLDPLVVVLGWKAEVIIEQVDFGSAVVIVNYQWEEGIGSSMRTGLDYLSRERVHSPAFVSLASQPGVTEANLTTLLSAHEGQVTVPVYRYQLGYPILLDRSQWDRFMSRDFQPLDIAKAHPEWVTEIRGDDLAPRQIRVPTDIPEALSRFGAA